MPVISHDMPPDEMLDLFEIMQRDGLIEYVLPGPGDEWVVGQSGQLLKFNNREAAAFLIGHQSTLQWLMAQLRDKGVGPPAWMPATTS